MTDFMTAVTAADAEAARLDVLLNSVLGDDLEDQLVEVGEVLGGLSVHGFAHDLAAAIRDIGDRIADDYECNYGAAEHASERAWLAREATDAQIDLCERFVAAARQVQPAAVQEAA